MKTLLLLCAVALGGCSLFEDLPDKSCKVQADCFAAQGEFCDTTKHVCVQGPDAMPTPLATPGVTP